MTTASRIGRPRRVSDVAHERITVRFSAAERAQLDAALRGEESLSDLVRAAALAEAEKRAKSRASKKSA